MGPVEPFDAAFFGGNLTEEILRPTQLYFRTFCAGRMELNEDTIDDCDILEMPDSQLKSKSMTLDDCTNAD